MPKRKSGLFANVSVYFFNNWRFSLLLWVAILVFGFGVYTKFIKREGFPTIQFPLAVVNGVYFADDSAKVDAEVSKPFYELASTIDGVSKVTTTADRNFFSGLVFFEESVTPEQGKRLLEERISQNDQLPKQARLSVTAIDPAAYLNKYDVLIAVRGLENATTEEIEKVSDYVVEQLKSDAVITLAEKQPLISSAINPSTGQSEQRQTAFSQIGIAKDGRVEFSPSQIIGVDRDAAALDIIELSEHIEERLRSIDLSAFTGTYDVVVGADFAGAINTQINSLEKNLLEGLLAVALVSFLLISWRASVLTGLGMVTVMAVTVGILYAVGYSLNTITLFALVLAIGLFVDDMTVVVESIDAHKRQKLTPQQSIRNAIGRVGMASFAGTFTTVFAFLPLAFLSGVLGEFIRLMPVTVIISLISSLVVSLTLIPFMTKFVVFTPGLAKKTNSDTKLARLEARLAAAVGNMPRSLSAKTLSSKLRALFWVGLSAAAFVGALYFASQLSFNIFPPTKDSDQLGYEVAFPEGYTIEQAQSATRIVDELVADEIGSITKKITYGTSGFGQPNNRSASATIELTPINERERKSPEILETLQQKSERVVPAGVGVRFLQFDAGPPAEEYPFKIQIREENVERALALAQEVKIHIDGATITRANGTTARVEKVDAINASTISRVDNNRQLEVRASFNADDTSGLLDAAEKYVLTRFTSDYLTAAGYAENTLGFDYGQESDNAESFSSLAWAFPMALLLMYVLLAIQFRSFLQPFLIFMAIPFSLFGVFFGLYLTNNALSFFVQVGLIGLFGIAVNNAILLTTFANQERKEGKRPIEAISNAVTNRFRPLLTTTITTIVALTPLALTEPFWEPLALTIMFGIATSTFFVILSYPYYYLATEGIRSNIKNARRKLKRA